MKELIITGSKKTPQIELKEGSLSIKGRSIPEDPKNFYRPVLAWIKEYVKKPQQHTNVDLQLEYCDTGSTKELSEILKTMINNLKLNNNNNTLTINWIYEKGDGEIIELGELIENKLKVEFNFVEI